MTLAVTGSNQRQGVRSEAAPSIPLRCSTLSDSLNKDAQFLQTHVSSSAHPDYTDTKTITVWRTQRTPC